MLTLKFQQSIIITASLSVLLSPAAMGQTIHQIRSGNPFYVKATDYNGIEIKAPAVVADTALLEARRRLDLLLRSSPNAVANLRSEGAELHIIGKDQVTSDLPEYLNAKGKPFEGDLTIDQRTRGLGGIFASCGEENLLRLTKDRYFGRDICVHEFSHTFMEYGLDEPIREAIANRYKAALAQGLWKGTYAATNEREFFAELTMWYFGTRGDYGKISPQPQPGSAWLKSYDPESFSLLEQIYTGRMQPLKINLASVPQVSPAQEATLKSINSDQHTTLRIVNQSNEAVKVYWLDYKGQRKPYGEISPYGRLVQNTYVGHPFLLADQSGRALAIFLPVAQPGVATYRR